MHQQSSPHHSPLFIVYQIHSKNFVSEVHRQQLNASAMMAEMGDLLKSFVPSKPASKEDEAQGKVLLDAALLTQ